MKPPGNSRKPKHARGPASKNAGRSGSRNSRRQTPAKPLAPGDVEYEMGVAIPGVILPQENWAQTALKKLPAEGPLQLDVLFGRAAKVALDIGCGNGRFVVSSALRRPDWDHLGIDILPMVIRYATRRANQRGLANCRFAACDGWRFLSQYCSLQSLNEIHIYHPQPYADPGQEHLRLLSPAFMGLVHRVLRPQGSLYLQTDNAAYWNYLKPLVAATMVWHDQAGPWPEDPNGRSRRELLASQRSLPVYRGWATRRDDLDECEIERIIATLPAPTFTATVHSSRRKR
jgi:tRNA (guanine-N7-)-methyltransferase